ncbi:D-isomer specific 2-hydroxyacid dehydrogenase family protein [Talaromyces stipitatus ATCC 10500]|uniref:D-isomer specific 2-hydroxyacid dehydrogenase family protein n=1 Tax=Talaromyces stipitatus (strain ATCC 10500 / CBS 375.48 / QM 6759 / NRRL 1006) TaxID=441959 RepID=B8M222_TALSN|nr:D-isomer specific 2-hydroxyacid dehydrogenase family protein [Talaromyces stipitatus ATCC 10500]EED21486.1 D-isomer specific 2-hydroxyacid dehydrogenase family protein [Talaromyces stipitatus ATCC 10500]
MAEHHHLVHLQAGLFDPSHQFTAPPGITLTQEHYSNTTPDQLHARLRDATILVLCYTRINAEALSEAVSPKLKFIAITAVGTDSVDLETCRRRGIRVSNCPGSNVESVSNHVMALYFAARRNVVRMDRATKDGTWLKVGSMLSNRMADRDGDWCLTCEEEVMGILGYGYVGKRVAKMAQALGMKVLIAGRKGEDSPSTSNDTDIQRIPFDEVLQKSTVLVIAVPRIPETMNMISTAEFAKISHKAVLINVSRGGIVDEVALLQALKYRSIHGAATDVFAIEPASVKTSPLLAEGVEELNLTTSPHVAWCADRTAKNYARMSPENVMNFLLGQGRFPETYPGGT